MDFWSIICWAFVMVMGALLGLLVEDLINRIDKRRRFKAAADERYFEIETAEGRRMLKVNGSFELLAYRLLLSEQGGTEIELKLRSEESDFKAAWKDEAVSGQGIMEALIEPDDDADILTAFLGSGPALDE